MSLEFPQCQELANEDDDAQKEMALGAALCLGRAVGYSRVTGEQ